MQFIKPTLCALAILSTVAASAQTGYSRYYNRMYARSGRAYGIKGYYYGPDGYYARCKEKSQCSNKETQQHNYNGPVFKRARYAEDRYGRSYLYLPSEK